MAKRSKSKSADSGADKRSDKTAPKKPSPATDGKNLGRRQAGESLGFLAIALVILVLVNILSVFFFGRIDATEARLFSLSQGSERLVADLQDQMEITAYFSPDMPNQDVERHVIDLLSEYEAAANGNLRIRVVRPDTDEEREAATEEGVTEVPFRDFTENRISVVRGFRGLVITYRGDRKVIPVIASTEGLEYQITQLIRELSRDPLSIGVMSGHGSPSLSEGLSILRAQLPSYRLEEVDASEEIDRDLRALLIVSPTEEIPEPELRNINQYLMRGGALGIFASGINVDAQGGMGMTGQAVDTGLNRLLTNWGIQIGQNVVADLRCGSWQMRQGMFALPVPYPAAPIVVFDEEQQRHPILFRINQAPLVWTSALEIGPQFGELGGVRLGNSSADEGSSWLISGDTINLAVRRPREWLSTMTAQGGPHTVMAALEGRLPSAFAAPSESGEGENSDSTPARAERDARVLVVGTGSLLNDLFQGQSPEQAANQPPSPGMVIGLNAVDWLAQDADLIAIRAKSIDVPALDVPQSVQQAQDEIDDAVEENDEAGAREAYRRGRAALEAWDSKKQLVRWLNTLLIPFLVAVFGVVRWQIRRSKTVTLADLRAAASGAGESSSGSGSGGSSGGGEKRGSDKSRRSESSSESKGEGEGEEGGRRRRRRRAK